MAVTKVVDIVGKAQLITQDTTGTRWTRVEIQGWLNDAYKEVIVLRPDANTQSAKITLAAGTRQSIAVTPAGALRLMDVVRNLAAGSQKRAIRRIDRRILDDQIPDWHAAAGAIDIQHFMFDDRLPKEFLVFPPALATAEVEIVYSSVPTPHALTEAQLGNVATADVIKLDDTYSNAILDYILYRSYLKDAGYAGNAERAMLHMQAFNNTLGVKSQVDTSNSPNPGKQGPV